MCFTCALFAGSIVFDGGTGAGFFRVRYCITEVNFDMGYFTGLGYGK